MSTFATPSPAKISRYSRYGSWQVLSEAEFQRGIVSDTAPVALPAGAVVDANDFLFDTPGKIRRRGGTSYAGAVSGSGCAAVALAPFAGAERLIGISSGGGGYEAWDVTLGISAGLIGMFSSQPPVFYNDSLYVLFGALAAPGRPAVLKLNAGTGHVGATDSVAPVAYVACVHAGYLVVANDTGSHANRLWFSPIPDPETTWDTSNAYIDTNGPITGLASVQGVLLVFHAGSSERILGSIPPGTVGENMSLQPLSGQAGCIDPGSIALIGGNVYFADNSGAWITNGASVTSLTSRPDGTGIASRWRSATGSRGLFAAMAVRGGAFSNVYYLVSVVVTNDGGSWSNLLYLAYHIPTGAWARLTMAKAIGGYAPSPTTLETYASTINDPHVVKLADLFAASPVLTVDADGTAILPSVTSRVLGQGPFEKAWGDGHLTYDMRGGATLTLELSKDIEQQAFQTAFTFGPVSAPTRQRFPISGDGHGLTFRITQAVAASFKTELYAVEVEHRNYEEQADG